VGGSLVVRGEPGIGKSALLEYARQRAAPMAVLSATGVEAESDLAFAGLHELLRPVLGHLGEVPDIQSRALAGALGLAASTHGDRLLISAAVLGLLAAAAEVRPTLCVVDDAQWLDRPSADALVFTPGGCGPSAWRSCSRRGRVRRPGSRPLAWPSSR
jgi:predicted ATP-dependent serine protease